MGPKKPPPKTAPTGSRPPEANGLFAESELPLWCEAPDIAQEDWSNGHGDFLQQPPPEAEHAFVDPAQDPEPFAISTLARHNKGWKRPSAIFSPFKPVVVKMTQTVCPYDGDLETVPPTRDDDAAVTHTSSSSADDGTPLASSPGSVQGVPMIPRSREDAIAEYRMVRKLKGAHPIPGADSLKRRGGSTRRGEARENKKNLPTPCHMQAFNSCLAAVHGMQQLIPKEQYLWELIYPQTGGANGQPKVPVYNPFGKYVVKLFVKGAWRRVVVDDRLPTDIFGHSLFTVTESKEIWPALLAKGLLRVLGPNAQDRFFTDPEWIMHALHPGYIPQVFNTKKHTATILSHLTAAFQNPAESEKIVLFALPSTPAPEGDNEEWDEQAALKGMFEETGLFPNQVYLVKAIKSLNTPPTTMVNVMSPFIQWKGEGSYSDTALWTEEFEKKLDASREQPRPATQQFDNCWRDAWMPWVSFAEMFPKTVLLRSSASTKAFSSKIIKYAPTEAEVAAAAAKAEDSGENPFCTIVKWIFVKNDQNTQIFGTYSTLEGPPQPPGDAAPPPPPPLPKGAEFTCSLESFSWNRSTPFQYIMRHAMGASSIDTFNLSLPQTEGAAYRLTCENFPKSSQLCVTSSKELTFLDSQEELLSTHLNLTTFCDYGEVEEHVEKRAKIWFKKIMHVKAECQSIFDLTVVPPGASQSQATPEPDKKGAKKGAKDAPAASVTPVLDEQELKEIIAIHQSKRLDLASWVSVYLVNMDTGKICNDHLGTLPTTLTPNKHGYMVLVCARPYESYPLAGYKLSAISNGVLDKGVSVGFKDLITKEGSYELGAGRSLFRFIVTPAELLHMSLLLDLACERPVSFTLNVLKGEDLVWRAEGWSSKYTTLAGPAFSSESSGAQGNGERSEEFTAMPLLCHNLMLPVPDKGATAKYVIECHIGEDCVQAVKSVAHARVQEEFRRRRQENIVKAREVRDAVLASIKEKQDNNEEVSDELLNEAQEAQNEQNTADTSPTHAPIPPEWGISYNLQLLCNTAKVSVDSDTTHSERREEIKNSWSAKEGGTGGAKDKGKASKQAAAVEDPRRARAQKLRQSYVDSAEGIFLPKKITTKDGASLLALSPEDDPLLRSLPPGTVTRLPQLDSSTLKYFSDTLHATTFGKVTSIKKHAAGETPRQPVSPRSPKKNTPDPVPEELSPAEWRYTVVTEAGETVEDMCITELETEVQHVEEVAVGDVVFIPARRTVAMGGKVYTVVPKEMQRDAGSRAQTPEAEWKSVEEGLAQARQEEEQRLAEFAAAKAARLQKAKEVQVLLLAHQKKKQEEVFNTLRGKGYFPKAAVGDDKAAKGKKK